MGKHNNHFYNGIPIDKVDFEAEFNQEFAELLNKLSDLKLREETGKRINYHYWTIKLHRANKALEVGKVSLDEMG